MHTKREKRWHLTPTYYRRHTYQPTGTPAKLSVCTRAELAGIANMFRGCAFNRTSYETSCSSFAHRGSQPQPFNKPEVQMALKATMPLRRESNAFALFSFLITFPNGMTMSVLQSSVFFQKMLVTLALVLSMPGVGFP